MGGKPEDEIEKHNYNVGNECGPLITACDRAISQLEEILKL